MKNINIQNLLQHIFLYEESNKHQRKQYILEAQFSPLALLHGTKTHE